MKNNDEHPNLGRQSQRNGRNELPKADREFLDDIDHHNLQILRLATKVYADNLRFQAGSRVLEIGPPRRKKADNSPIFEANPEWFYDLRSSSRDQFDYFDLDSDPAVGADFTGDLGSESLEVPKGFFDEVVCFSVLEHIPNLPQAVNNLFSFLRPRGVLHVITPWDLRFHGPRPDCWRISDDAYEYLLSPRSDSVEISKIENPFRPLSPVGLLVRAVKALGDKAID